MRGRGLLHYCWNIMRLKMRMTVQRHNSLVALALPLVPPPVELHLVHCPHGALHILHPGKAFVKTQIVTDGVLQKDMYRYFYFKHHDEKNGLSSHLPSGGVPSEKCKVWLEPVVDLVESELAAVGLVDGLSDEGGVGEGRPHVRPPVKITVLTHLRLNVNTGTLVKLEASWSTGLRTP